MNKMTALEEQYYEIKKQYQDTIVCFQLGDFYEMWNEDAEIVSKLLGLTLTKRNHKPMAGIPVGNIDFYLSKLVKEHELKVAICEQIETPEEAKKNNRSIVTRAVIKIVTPGSLVTDLPDNNYILACTFNGTWQLVYVDIATGECLAEETSHDFLLSTIYKIAPTEIILPKHLSDHLVKYYDDILHLVDEYENAYDILQNYLNSLKINITLQPVQINKKYFINLGTNTLRNLEVFSDLSGNMKNSLYNLLNKTQTSMGKRLLKKILANPIYNINIIQERQECIEYFMEHIVKINIIDLSKQIYSIKSIDQIYKIGENIAQAMKIIHQLSLPSFLYKMQTCKINCIKLIESTLYIKDDKISIRNNHLEKYEEEKNILISQMEKVYPKSKVKYNTLLGYFIETNKNIIMPDEYILKQDLSTTKRYTSLQIMHYESQIYHLNNKIEEIEFSIFDSLRNAIEQEQSEINKLSDLIAHIDYFVSAAKCALEYNYIKPIFGDTLDIKGARHAIIEQYKKDFISNDCILNEERMIICITGPNMGGKSTYLRSIALIILMAQCGMYVPASYAKLKLFDGLFVRIGAGDNIFTGDSTFQVEMLECAEALKHSTPNTFIVFDEVGRGTSIRDGISISYAICSYLITKKIYALVSTHYLEMLPIDGIEHYRIKTINNNSNISVLYELEPGIAESSFGLNIAKCVELPKEVLQKSYENYNKLIIKFNSSLN